MGVARYLRPEKTRLVKSFCLATKLHLCHHKPVIVSMKFIDLISMTSTWHKIAVLVYYATLAQFQQLSRLVKGNLFLKLIACHAAVVAFAFDGKIGLGITHPHTNRSPFRRDIALLNMAKRRGGALVGAAMLNQELAFYFQPTHTTTKNVQIM